MICRGGELLFQFLFDLFEFELDICFSLPDRMEARRGHAGAQPERQQGLLR